MTSTRSLTVCNLYHCLLWRGRADQAAFGELLKSMELVPVFGTSFTVYVPLVLVIVALLTYFNVYERLLQLVGIEYELTLPNDSSGICCCSSGGGGANGTLLSAGGSSDADPSEQNSASAEDVDVSNIKDPDVLEKVRTGKRIITRELKRLRNASRSDKRGAASIGASHGTSSAASAASAASEAVGKYSSGRSRYGKLSGVDDKEIGPRIGARSEVVLNPMQDGRYSDVPLDHRPPPAPQRDVFSILGEDEDDDEAGATGAARNSLFAGGRYSNL